MTDDLFARYTELVHKRKECRACVGLTNPAVAYEGKYDCEQISAWSLWQGNLNAKLLVVGQDFGDIGYFGNNRGRDEPDSETNQNLVKLMASRGYQLEMPDYRPDTDSDHFFTNGILCLKEKRVETPNDVISENGGMQAKVKPEWYRNCGARFLRPTIELVNPEILISLGEQAYRGILSPYRSRSSAKFRDVVENPAPILLEGNINYYPVYHCSRNCINRNRSWDLQMRDWMEIPRATHAYAP